MFHAKRFRMPAQRGRIKGSMQDEAAQRTFHVKQSTDILRRAIKTG